jgi:hypothetical protein
VFKRGSRKKSKKSLLVISRYFYDNRLGSIIPIDFNKPALTKSLLFYLVIDPEADLIEDDEIQ